MLGRRGSRSAIVGLAALALVAAACDVPQPWRVQPVTVDPPGTAGGDADTPMEGITLDDATSLSADGTRVAFRSLASNLVAGVTDSPLPDGSPSPDVFVRDLTTGETSLVSVTPDGTASGDNASDMPAISPDGTKVAFATQATNLGFPVAGLRRIVLRDLTTGTTTLVSRKGDGTTDPQNGAAVDPIFSPDGTKLLFLSTAFDFGFEDHNGAFGVDVFVYDLATGTTSLVTVDTSGAAATPEDFSFVRPAFSPDSTEVLFGSVSGNLVAGLGPAESNANPRLYLRDLEAGETTLVSVNAAGGASFGKVAEPSFSPDGTQVVFVSPADDLVPDGGTFGTDAVFVRDLATGTNTLVSAGPGGVRGNAASRHPAFTADGRGVVFESDASNLGPADTNGAADVYLHDLASGTTSLVSVNAAGTAAADHGARTPALSQDGRRVAFVSGSTDLGPPAAPGDDVYVRDLATGVTSRVTSPVSGSSGGPVAVGDPKFASPGRLLFAASDTDLGPTSAAGHVQLYVGTFFGADLAATLDAARSGSIVTLTATAGNAGPDEAPAARLAVLVPEGLTVTSFDAGGATCNALPPGPFVVVVCDLGDLAAGDEATLTVTTLAVPTPETTVTTTRTPTTAPATPGTTLTAIAYASSATIDPAPADALVTIPIPV